MLFGKDRRVRPADVSEGKLTDWAQCSPLLGLKFGVAKLFDNNWEIAGAAGVALSLVHAEDKVNKSEVFVDAEITAQSGTDAERVEEVRRHPHAVDPLGLAVRGQRGSPGSNDCHLFERVASVAPVEKRRVADVAGGAVGTAIADHHEPLGERVGKRPKEDGVQDAENRRVGADAERQGDQRDRRERRRAPQQPRGISHVAAEVDEEIRLLRRRNRSGDARPVGPCDLGGDV